MVRWPAVRFVLGRPRGVRSSRGRGVSAHRGLLAFARPAHAHQTGAGMILSSAYLHALDEMTTSQRISLSWWCANRMYGRAIDGEMAEC